MPLKHQSLKGSWKTSFLALFQKIQADPKLQSLEGFTKLLVQSAPHVAKAAKLAAGSDLFKETCNKFKGDGFEILVEIIFTGRGFTGNTSVDVTEYTPCSVAGDYGVDGVGINANNHKVVIQIKFRSDPTNIITYADMARTFADGVLNHGLDPHTRYGMILVTNTNGISYQCGDFFCIQRKLLTVINNKILSPLVKGQRFWDNAVALLQDTQNSIPTAPSPKPVASVVVEAPTHYVVIKSPHAQKILNGSKKFEYRPKASARAIEGKTLAIAVAKNPKSPEAGMIIGQATFGKAVQDGYTMAIPVIKYTPWPKEKWIPSPGGLGVRPIQK